MCSTSSPPPSQGVNASSGPPDCSDIGGPPRLVPVSALLHHPVEMVSRLELVVPYARTSLTGDWRGWRRFERQTLDTRRLSVPDHVDTLG